MPMAFHAVLDVINGRAPSSTGRVRRVKARLTVSITAHGLGSLSDGLVQPIADTRHGDEQFLLGMPLSRQGTGRDAGVLE